MAKEGEVLSRTSPSDRPNVKWIGYSPVAQAVQRPRLWEASIALAATEAEMCEAESAGPVIGPVPHTAAEQACR